jgi:hypothetical protein
MHQDEGDEYQNFDHQNSKLLRATENARSPPRKSGQENSRGMNGVSNADVFASQNNSALGPDTLNGVNFSPPNSSFDTSTLNANKRNMQRTNFKAEEQAEFI